MSKDQRKVSLADAAKLLGMSWQQAWRLVLIGELAGEKMGGRWIVTSESVDAYRSRPIR